MKEIDLTKIKKTDSLNEVSDILVELGVNQFDLEIRKWEIAIRKFNEEQNKYISDKLFKIEKMKNSINKIEAIKELRLQNSYHITCINSYFDNINKEIKNKLKQE